MKEFKKVAVLMGGTSNERDVSLVSGGNVAKALAGTGRMDVVPVTLDTDALASLPADTDACYIALHGGWGENGGVQAALDARGMPYTGPGAAACRLTMDKIATKQRLRDAGVPTADWTVATQDDVPAPSFGTPAFPLVVKAPRDGSSVGVYLVRKAEDFAEAVRNARRIDREKFGGVGEALVEAYVPGREVTVGVLDDVVLPVVEIVARGGWYGYDEKYNSEETRYPVWNEAHFAAHPGDRVLADALQRHARTAFEACGCRGVTRVDFRIAPDGRPYALELNTSPGMTGHSLVPKAAADAGLPFADLCLRVLGAARCDGKVAP